MISHKKAIKSVKTIIEYWKAIKAAKAEARKEFADKLKFLIMKEGD